MKPISEVLSVEAVLAAYKRQGLKPACGEWINEWRTACCAASAVAIDGGMDPVALRAADVDPGELGESVEPEVARLLGVAQADLRLFVAGFDGDPLIVPSNAAYEHGRAVRRAVLGDSEAP